MVCGQHFLGSELRYFQPVPWLTHMGGVAPTMRTATGIVLLSMVNPVEIAEQMATLDVLTDGRAIFGVGLGYSPHEFAAFGVEKGTKVARFEESLALVRRLWSGETVDFDGEFFSVHDARPSVRPLQEGGIPVWIGGQAAGAIKRAARLGDAWYTPPFPTHGELEGLRQLFLDTRAERGSAAGRRLPGPARAADRAVRRRPAWRRRWSATGPATRPTRSGASRARTPRSTTAPSCGPTSRTGSSSARRRSASTSSGPCGEEIGMTHFVYKPHWPGLAHADAMAQLEEFGTKVLPELRVMRLEAGQVAVVTGAASGIGRAHGRRLRGPGADRRARRRGARRRSTPPSGSSTAAAPPRSAAQVDVSDHAAVDGLAERVLRELGRVDVLCNNAGIIAPAPAAVGAHARRLALDPRRQPARRGQRHPRVRARHDRGAAAGHVVNTASMAGLTTIPGGGNGAYSATKHAVVGLSETLRVELDAVAPEVGVTVLCPGPVPSRIHDSARNRPAELADTGPVACPRRPRR